MMRCRAFVLLSCCIWEIGGNRLVEEGAQSLELHIESRPGHLGVEAFQFLKAGKLLPPPSL